MQLSVLYEDNHLLAIDKPVGLATMGRAAGESSLHGLASRYLQRKYHKPGNVFLGVVMRLDACASGVVLFARTSKAAGRLSEQFREREVEKLYWAVVERTPNPLVGEFVDWVAKDEMKRRMIVTSATTPGAKEARLRYRVRQKLRAGTLVAVALGTGRKHQIRLQFATRGAPILGDKKYGAVAPFPGPGIALHAARLVVQHPVRRTELTLDSPLPENWLALGIDAALASECRFE